MDRRLRRLDLKVDATLLAPSDSDPDKKIVVVYNINIPAYLNAEETIEAVARAQRLLELDFGGTSDVAYQVTASFYLRNTRTDFQRFWSGSFYAKGNSPAQLSPFQWFDSLTFAPNVHDAMQDAEQKLSLAITDSTWVFDRLSSIIINAQTKVSRSDPVLSQRGLFATLGRKLQVTFALP
jgi:hypothetical protein